MPKPLSLLPDAPISQPGLDRLDRMAFVRSFAEAIRSAKGPNSVVLALAGPWGSGKSSLINLICGELNKNEEQTDEKNPLIVKFNPWWFSGTGQLVPAFLQQLGAALSRDEVKSMMGEGTAAMELLARSLATPGTVLDQYDLADMDIQAIREKVNDIFLRSDRRILIFMDDIDRLSPTEMNQLLLIVRAIADFPNTTYVLSLDYEVVVQAMGQKLGVDGRTYLEKVIQLQIDVPLPGQMTLERMVIGQLAAIDPAAKKLDEEGKKHFRRLFEGGIKHFLVTPRACTRLLNVLRFAYPTVKENVYFPDMLGLATLMAFSSQAIQAMRSFQELFVGHCDDKGRGWLELKAFHTRWIDKLQEKDKLPVTNLVREMFPKVAWALDGPICGPEYERVWGSRRRICSAKHYDSYFTLGISSSEAAEYQWKNMIELVDDATAFSRALQQFGPLSGSAAKEWVHQLLQQASNFVNVRADSDQAAGMFRAIASRGDLIADVKDPDGDFSLLEPIHWVVSLLLDCLQRMNESRRFETFAAAVREDAGLLTASELIDLLDNRIDVFSSGDNVENASQENREKLRLVLGELDKRIKNEVETNELLNHGQYVKVLEKWHGYGRKDQAKAWLNKVCEDDQVFVQTIEQLHESEKDDILETDEFPIERLEKFIDSNTLFQRANTLVIDEPDWMGPDATTVLWSLLESLKQKK